jgi:hypothetical protein
LVVYAAFGLAVPRLRNARKPLWWALFFFIPRFNIIAAVVLLIVRERSHEPYGTSDPEEKIKLARDHMRERLRGGEPEKTSETQ